jgi:predicted RNA-binding protein YlxR (DUF448 family)
LWTPKAHGRSAYVCRTAACIDEALKKGKLERAIRGPVSVEERNALRQDLEWELR